MGWLSWAWFRCELNCTANPTTCISERLYMDMADQFVSRGLRDAGYEYINIGGCGGVFCCGHRGCGAPCSIGRAMVHR